MYTRSKEKGKKMSLQDLVDKLQNYYNEIQQYQDTDLVKFKEIMAEFRQFLNESQSVESGRMVAFNNLITNDNKNYLKYKIEFTQAENYFERIVELDENEKVIAQQHGNISINNFNNYLTDEFNKLFYNDVKIEIEKLRPYLSDKFIMVGCGSLPITLLVYCKQFPNISFIGIDNSAEAIKKAVDLKNSLKVSNLSFDIVDGLNYDYRDVKTIFVANTVIPKMNVLRQIAMSAKPGTTIIIRVPVLAGNLLSEDVIYDSIPRINRIVEFQSENDTDDTLYSLLVLRVD